MIHKLPFALACALCALAAAMPGPASAQDKKFVIAAPGIPPVFASTILYVADKEGFFKKYKVNAEIRPFDTGATDADVWTPVPSSATEMSAAFECTVAEPLRAPVTVGSNLILSLQVPFAAIGLFAPQSSPLPVA